MVRAAEQFCRQTRRGNRALIEDCAAQARLARVAAHTILSEVLALRGSG